MWKNRCIENGCVSFAFKYILLPLCHNNLLPIHLGSFKRVLVRATVSVCKKVNKKQYVIYGMKMSTILTTMFSCYTKIKRKFFFFCFMFHIFSHNYMSDQFV